MRFRGNQSVRLRGWRPPRRAAISVLAGVALAAVASAMAFGEIIGTPNHGHLVAFGPVSGDNGFPTWYKDDTTDASGKARRLELCLDKDNPLCGFLPGDVPDETKPIAFPDNFPEEAFYMLVGSGIDVPGGGQLVSTFGLEAAFANEVVQGDQMVFGRVRFIAKDLTPNATYTITHPYGVDELTADDTGTIKYTQDVGVSPGQFGGALDSRIGPFLRWDAGAPAGYLGDPDVEHTITGSPNNTNYVKLELGKASDPARTLVAQNDLFTVQGKYATNGGVDVDAVTYSRAASDSNGGTIDVFASSEVDPQSIEVSGDGFDPVLMRGENGHYEARVAYSGAKPAAIKVTNVGDVPASTKTVPVVDAITGSAVYNLDDKSLTINAQSSDKVGSPTLTASGFGDLDASGNLVINAVTGVPAAITVTSPKDSYGGSASLPVQLEGKALAPIPVTAFAGPDTDIVGGRSVTLDGTGSTGPVKTYAWTQTAGPEVTLSGADTAKPSFTAPTVDADTTLRFELTVNGSATDTVDVHVLASAPETAANAGPDQTVAQDTTVTLDASGSVNATKYEWKQTAGAAATLNLADPQKPTFRMPKTDKPLTFELTASNAGGSATDTVTITPKPNVLTTSLVEYRTDKREWRITGASDIVGPGVSVTIRNGSSATSPVLATVQVDNLGAWQYRVSGSNTAPTADRILTIESSSGGKLANVRVTVRS
jgi:hypothetical protein